MLVHGLLALELFMAAVRSKVAQSTTAKSRVSVLLGSWLLSGAAGTMQEPVMERLTCVHGVDSCDGLTTNVTTRIQ